MNTLMQAHRLRCYTFLLANYLLLLPLTGSANELQLNGLAVHTEFGRNIFIGALYTATPTDDPQVALKDVDKIELRVVSPRYSSRQHIAMWIQGMAINNPSTILANEAENMASFASLISKSLKAGDSLQIVQQGEEVHFLLNDINLGEIESEHFFNLLTRVWIGPVPLSSDFKNSLLAKGELDADILGSFAALRANEQRRQQIQLWVDAKTQPEPIITAAPTLLKSSQSAASLTEEQPPASIVEKQQSVVASDSNESIPTSMENEVIIASAATTQAPEIQDSKNQDPENQGDSSTLNSELNEEASHREAVLLENANASAMAAPSAEQSSIDELELDDEDLAPIFSAEAILSRQRYQAELMQWIYKHIRYPRRAIEKEQQGSVRIAVTIDREGVVQQVSEAKSSQYQLLNRAAIKAVNRASPFPPIPEGINGDNFDFTLPIVFRIPD